MNLDQVKKKNKACGQSWFHPDAIRFFGTILETELIDDRFFVTSERYNEDDPKAYTVRKVNPDGCIETIGTFQEHSTLEQALQVIQILIAS